MASSSHVTTIRRKASEHSVRTLPNAAAVGEGRKIVIVTTIRDRHEYEKEELSKLNNRFVTYIDSVKQLESLNKHVQIELQELQRLWGFDSTRLRQEYEPLMDKARQTMEAAVITKAQREIEMKRAEFDTFHYKHVHDGIEQWWNADQAKMSTLKSTLKANQIEIETQLVSNLVLCVAEQLQLVLAESKNDIDKYRADIKQLNVEFLRLLDELDLEIAARVKSEYGQQIIKQEIQFFSLIYEQEINELNLLASSTTTIDSAAFYKLELERAIREIRHDFEYLSQVQRQELLEYYRMKSEELVKQAQRYKQTQMKSIHEVRGVSATQQTILEMKQLLNTLQGEYNTQLTIIDELETKLETLRRGKRKN
ncbi:unnamed protein product [Didymodactylos carnosus]|uniref:IF rod domain-containing protein n=1 Tax=Didymodactylos carnosus TaxID=1234261 RepID=A0A8S2F8Q9_9BILA|nr:unnamed protein product [Didymodactylos carnosus]CAF4184493.1 unnamed protein product [Didymodactylos carnosus]